jgi:hypothetical protein
MACGAEFATDDPLYAKVPTPGRLDSAEPASDGAATTNAKAIMKLRVCI